MTVYWCFSDKGSCVGEKEREREKTRAFAAIPTAFTCHSQTACATMGELSTRLSSLRKYICEKWDIKSHDLKVGVKVRDDVLVVVGVQCSLGELCCAQTGRALLQGRAPVPEDQV